MRTLVLLAFLCVSCGSASEEDRKEPCFILAKYTPDQQLRIKKRWAAGFEEQGLNPDLAWELANQCAIPR